MNRCMQNTRAFGRKVLLCLMALALAMMSVPLASLLQPRESWAASSVSNIGKLAKKQDWVSETDVKVKWSDMEPGKYRFDLNQSTYSSSESTVSSTAFKLQSASNNGNGCRVLYFSRNGTSGTKTPSNLKLVFHPDTTFRGKKVNVTIQIMQIDWDATNVGGSNFLDDNVGFAYITDSAFHIGLTPNTAGIECDSSGTPKDSNASKMTYRAQKSVRVKMSVTYRSSGEPIDDHLRLMVTDLDHSCARYDASTSTGGQSGLEAVEFRAKFGGPTSTDRYFVDRDLCELRSGKTNGKVYFCASKSLVGDDWDDNDSATHTGTQEEGWERAGVVATTNSADGAVAVFKQQNNASEIQIMAEPNPHDPTKTVNKDYTQAGDTFNFVVHQRMDVWQNSVFEKYNSFEIYDTIDDRCTIKWAEVTYQEYDDDAGAWKDEKEIIGETSETTSNDNGSLTISGQKVTWKFSSSWLDDTSHYDGRRINLKIHCKTNDGVGRGVTIPNTGYVAINGVEQTASASIPVVQPAPSITKSADAELYDVGDKAHFTITFSQTEENAHGDDITVTDPLPDYFTYLDAGDERLKEGEEPTLSGVEGTISYDEETRTVTASVPTMEYGQTGTLSFTCLVEDFTKAEDWDGSYRYETTNVAVITMPNGDPTTAESEVPLTVVKPVLDVTKKADQPVYQIGDTATFTITVTQTTPDATAHNVVVTDPIPERFAYQKDATVTLSMAEEASPEGTEGEAATEETATEESTADADAATTTAEGESAASGSNDADRYKVSYDKDTATLTVTIDQLVYNETATIVFTCRAKSIGKDYVYDTTNIVTASADNADAVDAPADVSIVRPELGIEKTASKDKVKAGKDVDFQIVVDETREGAIAKNVVITDTLPDGQHLKGNVKVTLSNDADYTTDVNGQTITVTVSYLAYGDTATIDYTVTIDESCDDVTLKNIVTATADHADKVQADAEIYVPDPPPATDGYDKTGDFLSRYLWLIIALGAVVVICGGYGLYSRNRRTAAARRYVPRHSASNKYVPRHSAPHKRTYKNR